MKEFLRKYGISSLFALSCFVEFILTSNVDFSEEVIYLIYFTIPIILVTYGVFLNYNRYSKMKVIQILKYVLCSALMYVLSIIIFFYIGSNVESMFHKLDSEDYGTGMLLLMMIIMFTISIFIAYILPIILKFIVYCIKMINSNKHKL